ncbi:alpha/beta hydrolase family esterase [Thalassotalea euphylliae]|uniref:extracellular catalytic domain type 1 short-chain-length polyhydroxyalkanoate depolymerase n=1 Tax=Thalassotalea euphylliae TaxID=1655234 RepID=UPI0036281BFC
MAGFSPMSDFGDNPGDLTASYFQAPLKTNTLVVLLHGCVQNGEQLATQSGLLGLAAKHSFNLLVPQQHQQNNIKNCFNWFSPKDTSRGSGELQSLVNMIEHAVQNIETPNVYVVGLSAGGAMAATLLSQYPEKFAAGAVVAGLPYPCADNLTKAISCMRNGPSDSVEELVSAVSALHPNENITWPSLSVWTGDQDKVVNPTNATYLAKQWRRLAKLSSTSKQVKTDGVTKTVWGDENGIQVELVEIENMGHGMPVKEGVEDGGKAAPFLLNSPLPSAKEIIDFWQISTAK